VDVMWERNIQRLLLSVVFLLLFFVVRATAQGIPPGSASTDTGFGGTNTIGGAILLSTGQRAEHRISVRLQSMTRGDRVTTSDEYGNFVFRGLPPGDFTLVIDKEKGFEPFVQTVSIIQPRGMPPQIYNLSVRLIAKAGTAGPPGVINAELAKVPKRALDKYNKAQELSTREDRAGAIQELQGAIAEYPDFMLAYNELGVQYMKLNDYKKADEALQAALKINAKAFMPLLNRGIVLVTLKRYPEAEPLLREVVKIKSDSAVGHYFLGQAVANLGKFDEAEKELLKAVELGGKELKEAHRLLAIIYSSRGEKTKTIAELETYLQLAPTTPDAEQLRNVIKKLKGENTPTTPTDQPKP
jgi:Flp pilus assembly protein TadD